MLAVSGKGVSDTACAELVALKVSPVLQTRSSPQELPGDVPPKQVSDRNCFFKTEMLHAYILAENKFG